MISTETSRFCPESTAMQALIDPDSTPLLSLPFTAETIDCEWTPRGGHGTLRGYVERDGEIEPADILIQFPGIYERAVARICRREPRANLNITIIHAEFSE